MHSAVGIHQPIRIDPQEAGLIAWVQDHLDLDGVTDDRLTVTCMGDSPRIDLYHLGFIGTVELPAEEEFLTDPDVPVFHDPSIPFRGGTLHRSAELRQLFDGDMGGAVGVPRQFQLRREGLPKGVPVDLDDPPGTAVGPNLLNQVANLDVVHGSTLPHSGVTLHSVGRDADDIFPSLLVDLTFLDGQDLDRGALVVLGVVVTVKDVHVAGELLELYDEPGHRSPLRLLGGGGLLGGGLLGGGLHGLSIPFRG